jgi:putative membrane protein
MTDTDRWPGWVYGEGEEPDYRFSFANERTYLAWVRTALALLAAGVVLDVVDISVSELTQRVLAVLLVALGLVSAGAAWLRWAMAERAIRRKQPLPAFGFGAFFSAVIVVTALVLIVGGW